MDGGGAAAQHSGLGSTADRHRAALGAQRRSGHADRTLYGVGTPAHGWVDLATAHDLAAAAPVPRTRRARDLVARQRLERERRRPGPLGRLHLRLAGGPLLSNICAVATVPTGNTTVELAAHIIDGLLVAPGITVTAVRGLFTSGYANAPGWTEIELVGLPVKRADWSGIGKHGEPQEMVGSFTDAQTAAVEQVGWALTDGSGIAAPTWVAPTSLVGEVNSSLLDQLKAIVKGFASDQQAAQTISIALPPPANSSGQSMGGAGSTTTLAPLVMTLMPASTDPEFGTAYPPAGGGVLAPAVPLDFIVTALGTRAQRQVGAGGLRRGPDVRGRDPRHSAPEPRPAGFDRSLAGGGAALVVTFSGALPSAPGRDDHFAHKTARTTPAASALRKAAIRDATGSRSRVCRSTSARPDSSVLRSGREDRS